jgi:hypothetical protein
MKIESVYVFTQEQDLRLTRICVASVRFWHPDIPIFLVKDERKNRFNTAEIEQNFNVNVERFGQDIIGGCGFLIKFEPLFLKERQRSLILDSDIVFCGPVVERLSDLEADFIVAEDCTHGSLAGSAYGEAVVNRLYFNLKNLRRFDPFYAFPNRAFNAGQIVITTGLLKREDLAPLIDWSGVPKLKNPDIFKMGDQGVWNYFLHSESQHGRLHLEYEDFMLLHGDKRCSEINLRRIQEHEGYPFLIHWAGCHPATLSAMPFNEILYFFEDWYYARTRTPLIQRLWREGDYARIRLQKQFVNWLRTIRRDWIA